MVRTDAARRSRGNIRERGDSLHVRLFPGRDPVSGEDKLSEFRTQVINQRSASS